MGLVYMAAQDQPVRRSVALKVIKLDMDTRQVVARFEAERQALAMMNHPHIATVFDAGATDSGRPYFVMELARGIPITEYCDRNPLPTRERLDLFILVARRSNMRTRRGSFIVISKERSCGMNPALRQRSPSARQSERGLPADFWMNGLRDSLRS
jgi:serine/threonine protein kinase